MIKLGKGVSTGTFRRGDCWTCAARADGSIDWPKVGGVPEPMRPHGPEIRYASIAAVAGQSTSPTFEDCRVPFATLSDRALLYRGGDGQSVFAPAGTGMVQLPAKLRVAVMRGETPVGGAAVLWSFVAPTGGSCLINGTLCSSANSPKTFTDANGLAEVTWAIDGAKQLDVYKVQAALPAGPTTAGQPSIVFSAVFETAVHTGYTPGKCHHLVGITNVQDAIDVLCSKIGDHEPEALRLTSIFLIPSMGKSVELVRDNVILNAINVLYNSFSGGIAFGLDGGMPNIATAEYDPIVEVELDLPYPVTDPDRYYWVQAAADKSGSKRNTLTGPFGFQRVRLDGAVKVVNKGPNKKPGLFWTPSPQALYFIESVPHHLWGQRVNMDFAARLKEAGWLPRPLFERILCRIRLRSALIWVNGKEGRVYLNAEHLGVVGPVTGRELLVKNRDPQRAGDLDMFIYLVLKGFKTSEKFPLKPVKPHG